MWVSMVSCREMVPDPNFMLACMQGAWDELLAAADALPGQRQADGKTKQKPKRPVLTGARSPKRRAVDQPKSKCFLELVEERVAPTPPRLEPIVPNSGNGLKTKPFTLPQGVS